MDFFSAEALTAEHGICDGLDCCPVPIENRKSTLLGGFHASDYSREVWERLAPGRKHTIDKEDCFHRVGADEKPTRMVTDVFTGQQAVGNAGLPHRGVSRHVDNQSVCSFLFAPG